MGKPCKSKASWPNSSRSPIPMDGAWRGLSIQSCILGSMVRATWMALSCDQEFLLMRAMLLDAAAWFFCLLLLSFLLRFFFGHGLPTRRPLARLPPRPG